MSLRSKENSILIQNQLTVFASRHEKDVTNKHFKIFKIGSKDFCFSISRIQGSQVWVETYWKRGTTKIQAQTDKIHNRQLSGMTDAILTRLDRTDLARAIDIKIVKIPKPTLDRKKQTSIVLDSDKPKYKRNVRNKTKVLSEVDLSKQKPSPTTKREINEAKIERKIFKNSKLWKWNY